MRLLSKILIIILMLFLVLPLARAQFIRGALIAGGNATQVDGDECFGYHKYGWHMGASAILPLTKKKWFFTIETLYNQKGAYQAPQYSDSAKNGSYKLNLNYVDVPVMVLFEDKGGLTFGAGASWGRLTKVDEWENNKKTATTLDGPYSRNDFQVLLETRFKLYKRLKLNFRYSYSMAKIRTRTYNNGVSVWDRDQYNNVLSLRLVYVFNEKIKAYEKK